MTKTNAQAQKSHQPETNSQIALDQFPDDLPLALENIDDWMHRLYVRSAKDIVRQFIEHDQEYARGFKILRQKGYEDYSDALRVLLSPAQFRQKRLRNPSDRLPVPLEVAILRYYLGSELPDRVDFKVLRERLASWWPLVDLEAHRVPHEYRPLLMAIPMAFDAIGEWGALSDYRRDAAELAIFAAGSLIGSRVVLDAAIRQCPPLLDRYEGLFWSTNPRGQSCGYLAPIPDMLEERASYDCPSVWALLDAMTYFTVDLQASKAVSYLTPFDLVNLLQRLDYLNDLSDPSALSADLGKMLVAFARRYEEKYKTGARPVLDRIGIKLPFDLQTYLKHAVDRATPVTDVPYVLEVMRRLRDMTGKIVDAVRACHPISKEMDALDAEMRRLVESGTSANIERIGKLTADIAERKTRAEGILQPLKDAAVLPPPPASPIKIVPLSLADSPEPAEAIPIDETLLQENLSQASQIEGLREEARLAKAEARAYRQELERMRNGSGSDTGVAKRIADRVVADGRLTPRSVLELLEDLYGSERVRALPSAYESARKSERFGQVQRLYELLTVLVTDYRDAKKAGKTDSDVRQLLGGAYRANESELVTKSDRYAKYRRFQYEGRTVEMFSHLGVGVSDNVEETIRVHFMFDPEKGCIVVGWCGPHLPTVTSP